jgi:hypothetical protein
MLSLEQSQSLLVTIFFMLFICVIFIRDRQIIAHLFLCSGFIMIMIGVYLINEGLNFEDPPTIRDLEYHPDNMLL